ncbi:putative drought induced 19 type, zinc-binding protein [Helianthus annuus]|uniref:Drought induced 19 type, zinc-binding protein n=1 Tax=Helianthus annuus TaxID=4232 RepID=A0A251TKC3_HELAN|nr:protein DEHYDRATION-INDUCED 19 homolog 5 [Helianthus annuus]KAF5792883.1 putative drought induced 19 type, zinc-binding protein [Helianthus annuus]KAJ0527782.1 putative drought induced 19 type, zinc-binding protein [Helianthus annuus]KAJ0544203.1 putative drought induced 19 type, zinc-binding protein [Helianthus annuus]KAJ0709222.1 putative drought induced 19 type, zinc-binding protein [Helianthus annuus]KAJ0713103.1 putative drought induced 19 type, zinc-binding protein [Helianthus annuus]
MDFWGSRAHSSKHHHFHTLQSNRHNNSDNHLTMDGDDDVGAWFPCPFCYIEIEIPVLCYHLQEEHCFDLKNAVCPICAANLGKDALAHFTSHHVHSIKRRRKSQRSGLWSNGASHTRETTPDRGHMHETTPDPLSAFLGNVPFSDLQEENISSATSQVKSSNEDEKEVKDHEEERCRAAFVQELVFSTIF